MYMMLGVKRNNQATRFSIKYCLSSDKAVLLFKVLVVFLLDFIIKRGFWIDFFKSLSLIPS
jgi:hypothetical protein